MDAKTRLKAFLAGYDLGINQKQFNALAEMVADAERDAYNRAIEDAAMVCDKNAKGNEIVPYAVNTKRNNNMWCAEAQAKIDARDIRFLKKA